MAELRLDLGSGPNPREGFEGVDWHADVKHKVDLFVCALPFADASVDEIWCSHFMEHIPADYLDGRDRLCAFMDECWRVLKVGATMTVIVPNARSNRAFQDPTHRRFFVAESFLYFNREWREANKLGHYLCTCNFAGSANPIIPTELSLLHPEAQARRFNESWNTVMDWQAVLVKQP